MYENIIETKICKQCGVSFSISDKDEELYQKLTPNIGGIKYPLPHPSLCPDCRQQRRLARRNERHLYHGTCALTGKKIISLYSPDKKFTVYHYRAWRSDGRDPMHYTQDFDVNQTFFQQFETLLKKVPRISTYNKMTENTEYGNNLVEDKNCYLLFITFGNENCYYGSTLGYCKNCVDCLRTVSCQNCYECVKAQNCYECFYCFNCQECFNAQHLSDCINVDNSMFCVGLRNKKHYILNKAYSKQEYQQLLQKLEQDKIFLAQTKEAFIKLKQSTPVNANAIEQSENSSGDCLNNCKNCVHCFDTMLGEESRYTYDCANIADGMDQYLGGAEFTSPPSQLVYECDSSYDVQRAYFCSCVASGSNNILYCDSCDDCKNCFGCIGLQHKEYCILNKQYTKEEYQELVHKIIEKMKGDSERGEFFPSHISPFCYNETEAQMYYPMSKEQVEVKGRKRFDEEKSKSFDGNKVLQANDLPNIQNLDEKGVDSTTGMNVLEAVVVCEVTGKPFKIIKQELDFYRKYHLPLPRKHPDQRHLERVHLKTPRKLFDRTCAKCGAEISTGYAPNRPEIVYCSKCYYKHVYG